MRFDLLTLNLVLAVAETCSITRAAQREHLALAAASKRLKDLEARLGVQLFDRRARGVEITEAGRAMVRHIRGLHASLHALESEVVEFSRGIKGHLRVVANAAAIAEALPGDLAAFGRSHPQIRISLEDLTSAEVQQAVAEGRADVGICAPPVADARLQAFAYRDGELAAVLPLAHPLAGSAAPVAFAALLEGDLVGLPVGTSVHELMMAEAVRLGRTLGLRMQVRGFDAICQLVDAGMGAAVLPAAAARRYAQLFRLAVRPLADAWAHRTYQIVARDQPVQPATVQRFIDALTSPAGEATAAAAAAIGGFSAAGALSLPALDGQSTTL